MFRWRFHAKTRALCSASKLHLNSWSPLKITFASWLTCSWDLLWVRHTCSSTTYLYQCCCNVYSLELQDLVILSLLIEVCLCCFGVRVCHCSCLPPNSWLTMYYSTNYWRSSLLLPVANHLDLHLFQFELWILIHFGSFVCLEVITSTIVDFHFVSL